MAEKNKYPQIPSTVWWGTRAVINKTPSATIDERLLAVQLGVQEVAARQYISELKSVGILSDENKATALALKWRLEDGYAEAVNQLLERNYPEGLLHVAPPRDADRQKVVRWFQQEGLGQGAAGNKAATYLLIGSSSPNEAPGRTNGGRAREEAASRPQRKGTGDEKAFAASVGSTNVKTRGRDSATSRNQNNPDAIPLNINVQIHISADAGTEQIESIFAAMRRYLYDKPSD
ncbi:hypothetical protein CO731_00051 [Aminobacter sp. MSH1]|uniref:hypothetical protein n=1 Tax=Aminobacter sp. MSH1 TaxID=374606 RepID=UPI000D504DFC|nr:hypothetical protein [Aminobacter sp. MSH1]AWC20611.1 hypothetical protein CO731_00051 [Aminobacter sp. MSH1]